MTAPRRGRDAPGRAPGLAAVLLACFIASPAAAQFGQNKVQYRRFEWKMLETGHVRLYHYGVSDETAREAARIAEAGYAGISGLLDHVIEEPVPILLFASPNHFQQTNAVSGLLGEGTGGVTESFRKRVVLPFTGSYAQLAHVMTHELTHAFQFDRLQRGVLSIRTGPPLWIVEGMAEYLSVGRDPFTDMWVRDALRHGKLPTLRQLAGIGDIRVYRLGQAVWAHVGEAFGLETARALLRRASAGAPVDSSFSAVLGSGLDSLSRGWHESERRRLDVDRGREAAATARAVTSHHRYMEDFHIAPALSPDGTRVAYFTNDDLFIDLVVGDTRGGRPRRILRGGRTASFESLRFLDSAASFSPDGGRIAVIATSEGRDVIRILDAETGETEATLRVDADGLSSPSWSPDGGRIVVVGLAGGWSDLYIVGVADGGVRRLMRDRYAALHPSWSPDGSTIAFATDLGAADSLEALARATLHIGLCDVETGAVRLLTAGPGEDISPSWSPDGKRIAFSSSRDGRYNLYAVGAQGGTPERLTDLVGGAVGITALSPCLSWSRSGALAFTAFDRGGWDVFVADDADTLGRGGSGAPAAAGTLGGRGPGESAAADTVRGPSEAPGFAAIPPDTAFAVHRASRRLGLNVLSGAVGFGGNVGFAGQTQVWLSDVFGDRNLLLAANIYGDITESDIAAGYFNLGHRFQWAVEGYQYRDDFGFFTLPDSAGYRSQIFRGAAFVGSFPRSRFLRFEGAIEAVAAQDRVITQTFDSILVEKGETFFYAAPSVAFVFDNAVFGGTGPLAGHRLRLDMETTVGDIRSSLVLADARSYDYIGRLSAVARRLAVGTSLGRDARLFRVGGPFTFRGAGYGELSGTRTAFGSVELRFSVFPRLSLLYVTPFFDMAAAWNDTKAFRLREAGGGFRLADPRAAYGIGFRLGLGGIVLRYDVGQETDLDGNIGSARHFFTIAPDF